MIAARRRRAVVVAVVLLCSFAAPVATPAHLGATDTAAVLSFDGFIEFRPGLCLAVDTPLCTGPHEAQFHVVTKRCTANGTFEGVQLLDAPCSWNTLRSRGRTWRE